MTSLSGILGMMIVAILVGKQAKEVRPSSYILIFFLALIEVAVVLIRMYTMSELSL